MGHLADRAGLQEPGVSALWDLLLRLAIEETKTSGVFLFPGVGKIVLDRRKARKGRNPQTGQPMVIPPKTTLRFRFATTFKDAVLPGEHETPPPVRAAAGTRVAPAKLRAVAKRPASRRTR
jgi:DNA-binding protein HU-beta